jgi:Flp pilus assembly protein TadG
MIMTNGNSKPRRIGIRAILTGERGQNLLEFALAAPIVMLMLVSTVELGRLAYLGMLVKNAAHAGVQYGAQNLATAADSMGMQDAALNDGQNMAGLTATASHYCSCADGSSSSCAPGDCASSHRLVYVQVNTTGQFQPLLHWPGLPTTYTVNGRAVMRVAQ